MHLERRLQWLVSLSFFYYLFLIKEKKKKKPHQSKGWDLAQDQMKIQEMTVFPSATDTTQAVGNSFLGIYSEASGNEVAASAPQGGVLISHFLTPPSFFDSCLRSQKLGSNCNDKGSWAKQRSADRGGEKGEILRRDAFVLGVSIFCSWNLK